MYHEAQKTFASHGVMVDNVKMDVAKMMAQKDKAVKSLVGGVEMLLKKNKVGAAMLGSSCTGAPR